MLGLQSDQLQTLVLNTLFKLHGTSVLSCVKKRPITSTTWVICMWHRVGTNVRENKPTDRN